MRNLRSLAIGLATSCPAALAIPAFAATITVTNPNASSTWYVSSQYAITWVATDVTQNRVKVDLLQGSAVVESISSSHPTTEPGLGAGRIDWLVPATLQEGQYTIRVRTTNRQVEGVSAPFTIQKLQLRTPPDTRPAEPPPMVPPDQIRPMGAEATMLDLTQILSNRCELYARLSIFAQETNQARKCGYSGPEWTTDFKTHFDWCMERIYTDPAAAEGRYKKLFQTLQDCAGAYDVRVTMTELQVHDDCDNVSKGDWYVALGSSGHSAAGPDGEFAVWPSTTSASNVDTGDVVTPNLVNRFVARGDSDLHIVVGAVDCDGNGAAWFLPVVGVPVPPLMHLLAPYEQTLASVDCSGEEEFWEYSGGNDYLDYTELVLSPPQWRTGGSFTIVAGAKARSACGSDGPPFTASITLQATRR